MTTDAEAVGLKFNEAVQYFRQKANVTSTHWTDVWRKANARAFTVAGATSEALVADFREAIDKAILKGTTLAEFRKDFDAIVKKHGWEHNGAPAWRAKVIYETNLSMAYSAGRYAQMTRPSVLEGFPYWQYVHSGSLHPRLQHLAWDGLCLRADDPFWDTHWPPNGWHCGCRVRPMSKYDLERLGKSGPDEAPPIQTRPWINKVTGDVHQVPVGIDPGFDYNPGKAWKAPVKAPDVKPVQGGPAEVPFNPIDTSHPAVAGEQLAEAQRPWAETLSETEAEALARYKGGEGRLMNEAAHAPETVAPEVAADVFALETALARAEAPADMVVFRGVSQAEADLYRGLARGETLSTRGFLSMTLDREHASRIADTQNGIVIEIVVRKGQKGVAYVHPFPSYRYRQYEVLGNLGTVLRVLRADEQGIRLEIGHDIAVN